MPPRTPPAVTTPGRVPATVVRSLYRSVMREANKLDALPVTKALLPMPKKLQDAAGLTAQLHMPSQISYAAIPRRLFRDTGAALPLKAGFDALNTLRMHLEAIGEEMPRITKDHASLLSVLDTADVSKDAYWAKPIAVPAEAGALLKVPTPDGSAPTGEVQLSTIARMALLRKAGFDLKVGTALMAHPLSSAHSDRRVMLIVEKNAATTTALVLDMLYSYPLSHGNPMFPEVLWGHEVHNGGYCHVDFTMPPTANVSVLHTLGPPEPETPSYSRWLQWATRQQENSGKTDAESVRAQHEACCHPVIRADGKTLYYSKVEALPYLATLAQGQPRESLRVYWGCMKWATPQLVTEVATGHWMPAEVSPSFFGAYTVRNEKSTAKPDDKAVAPEAVERFPTEQDLKESRQQRERHLGANVTPPQVFPPTQPMCRREALWDQIMHSLGGDYRQLVGTVNPFASPKGDFARVPPMAGVADLASAEPPEDGIPDGAEVVEIEFDEDDIDRLPDELGAALDVSGILRRAAERAHSQAARKNKAKDDAAAAASGAENTPEKVPAESATTTDVKDADGAHELSPPKKPDNGSDDDNGKA